MEVRAVKVLSSRPSWKGAEGLIFSSGQANMSKSKAQKLSTAICRKTGVPAGKSQIILWDSVVTGLGLRCLSGGSRTWIFAYRADGGRRVNSQRVRLGSWPEVSVDDARRAARFHAGTVAGGRDPAADRREQRRREKSTLRLALDDFERSLTQRRLVNVKTTMSSLRRGLTALLGRDVKSLTRSDYVDAVHSIEKSGRWGAAQDLRKHTRTFAEWCVGRGLADHNVLAGLRRPRKTRAERLKAEEKGRALSDAEIKSVWIAADELGTFGRLVQLSLLTGMRRGELSGLRRGDVKSDRLVLEAQHTKTGTAHEVPVTELMSAVLARQPLTSSKLVFPSSRTGTRVSGWTKLVKQLVKSSGVDLTMHDLRRTCRTLMSRLGVPEDIAELAIGHQRADLVGRYNKDVAWEGRIAAFEQVSTYLLRLIEEPSATVTYLQAS
ncbi:MULTISPECIES: tyrosine-type recombinase/integrase [Bradyrhizobium]|uniref:tyrosine-type recombinase/integrase n=1 Tax=Bradyrhizobium TaxID=374 RepID=UPI001EDA8E2F|nr:tyrosine-type recombinase/integrase [Bradyrhizobium zhengyangense]MCG2644288.1 tyrosine-type recombinase/integrase [Bradyrhizobium zhengyangense]